MAEAIAGPLLGKLQELALDEAKVLVQVKDDIRCLRDRLMWLQAFLLEADPIRRVNGNLLTGVLVSQTRAVALDSEDAIDRYLVLSDKVASRRGWRRVIIVPKLLKRFAQQILVRHYLSVEVTMLNKRIEEILHSREKYNLDDLQTGEKSTAEPQPSWTLPTAHGSFNGYHIPRKTRFEDNWYDLPSREMDKKGLIYHLSRKELFAIFMEGGSGVGKTAVMRSALNDPRILGIFRVRIWIVLPPGTRDTTVASQIKQKLGVASSATDNICPSCFFKKNDSSSRHRLVVIECNDVRFTDQRLSEWLPNAGEQDKIVLITNKKVPAAVVRQTFKHDGVERGTLQMAELTPLEREDVRLLFYYKLLGVILEKTKKGKGSSPDEEGKGSTSPVFKKEGSIGQEVSEGSTNPVLKDEGSIGQEVAEEEKGSHLVSKVQEVTMSLPRAVVMLAHLLRTTERSRWGSLFQHICKSSKVEKRLQRILLLSFNALPNDLKSCFLYFAAFPEETEICTQELVRLWAAEGFLCPKDGKSMEFIGHGHLKELISRDLVQVVTNDVGFVQSVSIASYVHNFLRVEARETSFLDVHLLYHVPDAATVRRLSIPDYQCESSALERKYPKLRSLISREVPKEQDNFRHTVQAQPVSGEDDAPVPDTYPSSVNEDPKVGSTSLLWTSLQTLINRVTRKENPTKPISRVLRGSRCLRVISLQGHNVGEKMLRCVRNKVRLRYLRVESRNLTRIPVSIGDLPRLQTLDVRGTKISQLPDEFWKIQTLRHVLGDSLRFPDPASATNLRNLQTLETMSLKGIDKWDGEIMLKNMLSLETLAVEGIDDSHDIFHALDQLIYLKRLRLYGDNIKLGSLGLHNNLELMELTGKLIFKDVDFEKTSKLFNLSVLKLMHTHVDQAFIKNIAQLPNLNHLLLLGTSFESKLEIPEGFVQLEVLKVSDSASSDKKLDKIVVNSPLRMLRTFQLISSQEITFEVGHYGKDEFKQLEPSSSWQTSSSGQRYIYSFRVETWS